MNKLIKRVIAGAVFCGVILCVLGGSPALRGIGLAGIACLLSIEVCCASEGVVRSCGLIYLALGVCGWWHARDPCLAACLTWASDSGGYVFGRLLGDLGLGRPFARLSPGKTWAGYAGSACSTWLGYSYSLACGHVPLVPWQLLVAAACLGDLVGSYIKRQGGIKDYSQLIPGHGGLMDRCDSLWMVGIVWWLAQRSAE